VALAKGDWADAPAQGTGSLLARASDVTISQFSLTKRCISLERRGRPVAVPKNVQAAIRKIEEQNQEIAKQTGGCRH